MTGIRLKKTLLSAALFLAVFLPPVFARDVEIVVVDTDLELALEGALIHSWDGKEYACNGEGKARISVPDDRQAVIRVSYPGYENGRLVIPPAGDSFTVSLRLSGMMENRELVIEAEKPGESETKSGRSVAISDDALKRTAEIGIIEDVMTSIKLLPGVGFAGMFNAMPSIRGGDPGDLTAVLDGFYIENPYHWGGGTSIFDPKMVSSARLSHGVFSARYGHTISGLLEVNSRKPSPTETEFDLGLSSSAASINLSIPLFEKGGVMFMGKVTYWDPFVWAAKNFVEEVRYIEIPPFIRDAALSSHYRFSPDMELSLNGFFGSDGIGVFYNNPYEAGNIRGKADMRFYFDNLQGFLISALIWNPTESMVFKASAGAGFLKTALDGYMQTNVNIKYTDQFLKDHDTDFDDPSNIKNDLLINGSDSYTIDIGMNYDFTETTVNYQGAAGLDWDLGRGFILALGLQELYTRWVKDQTAATPYIIPYPPGSPAAGLIDYVDAFYSVENQSLNSSAYALLEYTSPGRFFGAELGFRADHLYFMGKDFSIQTLPAFNPRLNLDFTPLKNRGILDSLGLTLGTGLFSSIRDQISNLESRNGIDDYELKQNRSWTSVAGVKLDFKGGYSLNIEGYYKYVFDRGYSLSVVENLEQKTIFNFDGEGRIWGFDLQLQKFESRWWDGWLSYSFTHARYREKARSDANLDSGSPGSNWYWPSFHRFHNLNLVLNIKPSGSFSIATRLGLASGVPLNETGAISSRILEMNGTIIEYYNRASFYSQTNRTTWSIPLDIKFSWFFYKPTSKVQTEIYCAVENLLSLIYTAQGNSSFNSLTGEEEKGSRTASYEMPIPMISFGCKWSY